jgi:MAF protein
MKNHTPEIILASGSAYRRELLSRLVKFFDVSSPNIDESILRNENPHDYVSRLAREKAQAVADSGPSGLIIGSDQTAVTDTGILGKPGGFDRAVEQLTQCSGKEVRFLTGLALLDTESGRTEVEVDEVTVRFRQLTPIEIENYLLAEQPYDCAGSFKCEGLGISLFESIESSDPNSLIGLPLIRLNKMLIRFGYNPLLHQDS